MPQQSEAPVGMGKPLGDRTRAKRYAIAAGIALGFAASAGCDGGDAREPSPAPPDRPPNVLWIVWDTVRADHMSVYGYERPTTPHLEAWARNARIFENVVSVSSTTVPSHASMFTGLLPDAHGADNRRPVLDPSHATIAELLRSSGYATYCFSANPHLRAGSPLTRGFHVIEHPWSPLYRAEAEHIVREKTRPYETPEGGGRPDWAEHVKTAGSLARKGVERWLSERDPDTPYFIFLNYMEAHAPLVPDRRQRARFLREDQVERSYSIDFVGMLGWSYTVGLTDIADEDLEVVRGTYDAALGELDELFRELMDSLERGGYLDQTVVILTSDHGELLGEHHMLDHQFSLHREVLNVPLILHHPPRLAPGRQRRPVTNLDLFPTLLQLTGLEETARRGYGVSLLAPVDARARLAEYPRPARNILALVTLATPGFDPTPFGRSLRALHLGDYKYIWSSDGRHELYDLAADVHEQENLAARRPELARSLESALQRGFGPLRERPPPVALPEPSEEVKGMLRALGYESP